MIPPVHIPLTDFKREPYDIWLLLECVYCRVTREAFPSQHCM